VYVDVVAAINYLECTSGTLLMHEFFVVILSGTRLSPLGTAATSGLLYQPHMIDEEDWQGKPKYSEKTCPSATLYTTNPMTRPGLEAEPPRWEAGD
jgi:hypothetical protein